MNTISVVGLIGTPCLLAHEKGEQLRYELEKHLQLSGTVVVDFTGYEFISSTFLNHSFGQLCIDSKWGRKEFLAHIKIMGISDDDTEEVDLAISNAEMRMSMMGKNIFPEDYLSSTLPA
jgi:hypothetical protein